MKHSFELRDKRGIICFLISAISFSLFAQTTYYSRNAATAPRNWDEADSWTLSADGSGASAAIPSRTDNVVVLNGHTIVVDNVGDNGATSVSANGLGRANVGAFNGSGTPNFYHTGNIYVRNGGTISFTARAMLEGITFIDGTISTSSDFINLGRLEITSIATASIGDDFILSGNSETLVYNTSTSADDIYLDNTDALLCGNNTVDIGDAIQYFNGATSDQICTEVEITGCGAGCPTSGTGTNTIGSEQNLINKGATWRYLDDGTDQGTAWTGTSFDDSGWSLGNAELGYGDGDETTTVGFGGDANNKYTTTYFRTTFYVEDRSNYTKFLANINFDDGVVVYINGTEVIRDNMPTGTITSSTFASAATTSENVFQEFPLSVFSVVNGTNTIAVEIHQANLTSSDISFDMELVGSFSNELIGKGETWSYLDDGTDQGTTWTGTSFDDSGWSSGDAEFGYGDGDETTTVGFGGDTNNKYVTTYFRKSFSNTEASPFALKVGLKRDDGAVVYLNGNEIVRDNMPTGTITYTTLASNAEGGTDEVTYFTFEVDPADLVVGTNYIAVEIHQADVTSSDISFDLYLEYVQEGALLPVSLIEFSGKENQNGIDLSWSTATEINNYYFKIDRSHDGIHFQELARVSGAGNTEAVTAYNMTDHQPMSGVNYYRLTQYDFDGQFEVLGTIRVSYDNGLNDIITAYPNPTTSKVTLHLPKGEDPNQIVVCDLAGASVKVPLSVENRRVTFDFTSLTPGLYVIKAHYNGQIHSKVIRRSY